MAGFIGAGDLWFDRFDDEGNSTGWVQIGNATKFAIQEATEKKERLSKMKDTYGQALDTVYLHQPAKISFTLDDFDKDTLAMALLGEASLQDVSEGSVTDETINAKLDKYVALAHDRVKKDPAPIVTNEGGDTTYTENEDYVVDYDMGMIKALSSGDITEGQVLKVDYSYEAKTYQKVAGSKKPTVQGAFVLNGKNWANGKNCKVRVYKAVFTPSSEIDFLADDFGTLEFEGTLVTPSGQSEPYVVEDYNV